MRKSITSLPRRMLSIVLCTAMLVTTFCFFDIGSVISEALVTNSSNPVNEAGSAAGFATYSINVPEIIYMTPGGTTSKYFLNNNGDGTVVSGYQTEGNFSFSCATAKTVKVSAKLLTSTLGTTSYYITGVALANGGSMTGTSTSGTGQYSVSASSFSTSISSITMNTAAPNTQLILQWTIQYTISVASGATTYTTYAYSGVKCPNLQQAGMATYGRYGGTFTSTTAQAAYSFITGVDSISGGNTASTFTNYSGGIAPTSKIAPLVNFSGSADGGNYTMPTGNAVISGTDYFPTQSGGGVYKYWDSSSRSKIWYVSGDSSNTYNPSSSTFGSTSYGNASITLDSSRFTNFNQVPFLSCGYAQFYHHWEGGGNYLNAIRNFYYTSSDAASYFRNNRSVETESSSVAKPRANTLYCSVSRADEDSTTDNRSWVRGLYAINGAIPSSSGNTYMRFEYTNIYSPIWPAADEYYSEVAAVQLTWTLANKSTLRSYYYKCLNSGVNDKASNWSTYLSNLQDIAKKLCVMTNTTTSA
ncbi:MAG: hypothetical protein IJT03_04635, partial [Clostridia bacterium]|nr:hypothetical protein [Clostridia bacterium]